MKIFLAGKLFIPEGVRVPNRLLSYHYIDVNNGNAHQTKEFLAIIKTRRKNGNRSERRRTKT